jgi:RNA-directed DNA polymerase
MCGTTKRGKFTVRRCTIAKRLRKKLQEVKQTLRERMHWPIEQLGAWLKRVGIGHYRYSGVPRNMGRLWGFRERLLRYWCHILRRRSQRHRVTWQRMYRLAPQWLPAPPHDASVSCATRVRHDPRQEPGAVVPHAGIWAGAAG